MRSPQRSAREASDRVGDAYAAWTAAVSSGDVQQFTRLLDGKWFGTAHDGTTVDGLDVRGFMALAPADMDVVDHVVVSHGEFHLVRGTFRSTSPDTGPVRFVALWREGRNGLKCLTHHETVVVESAFAPKPLTTRVAGNVLRSVADASTVAKFRSIYDDLAVAMPAQDLDHLDSMIDSAWFTTDPGGELRDKAQYMDFARTYYAPSLTFDVGELFVRRSAPFTVVSCRYTLNGRFGDGVSPNQAVRVTGIWLDRDASSVYIAQQGSFIP